MTDRVVVIGAGILGALTAYRLAERGAAVTLIDAHAPGSGTTATSYAHVNASYAGYWDYFALRAAGVTGYRRLRAELGEAPWLKDVGCLHFETDREASASLAEHVRRLEEYGYSVASLTPAMVSEMEPDVVVPATVSEIFFYPDEGYIHGPALIGDLLTRADRHGAVLRMHDPVVAFNVSGGRVRQVRLRSGEHVAASQVVCCCGRWTDAVLAMAETEVNVMAPEHSGWKAPGLIVLSSPVAHRLTRMIIADHVNVRPAGGGRLMVWVGDVDEAVQQDDAWLEDRSQRAAELAEVAMGAGREYVPALRRAHIEKTTICVRALPADCLPVVGWVPDVDGLYVIAAHAAVSLAPAVADIACAELLELREDPRLADFRPTRFVSQDEARRGESDRTAAL